MGFIYKIINKINNKVYIGQTERSIAIRWKEHCTDNRYLTGIDCAIKKYGANNFLIEQIEECSNELLNERERYWIKYYNSYENGYNNSLGGQLYQNTRLKDNEIQQILDLWNNSILPITHIAKQLHHGVRTVKNYLLLNGIEEEEIIQRRNKKKVVKEGNKKNIVKEKNKKPCYSLTTCPIEEKNKIIELFQQGDSLTTIYKKTGHTSDFSIKILKEANYTDQQIHENYMKKNNRWKDVYCYNLTGELIKKYTNRKELLADYSEKQIKMIYNCCIGLKNSSQGLKWSYVPLTSDEAITQIPKNYPKKCGKFTLEGQLISQYKSIAECARQNNCSITLMTTYINNNIVFNDYKYAFI